MAIWQGLVGTGVQVDMVCHPEAPEQDALAGAGVGLTPLVCRHRLDTRAVHRLRAILHERRPDIVYSPRNKTLSVSLLASRGMELRHVAYRGTIGHLSRWDPASWLTYFHPRVDRIVCVSEAVRQYLLSKSIPDTRLVTIYKGHDVAWYDVSDGPSRADLGLSEDAFVVGFTGSMRRVKGVDVLLKAAALLGDSPKVRFLLVGEVRDRRVKRLAAVDPARGTVHFTGFRPDAALITGVCDLFVMPSIEREGLPRSVIEAMAQRVPTIVTNVGGMPELVVHGETGLVVPPGDPQAIARAIRSLAGDRARCRLYGENARKRIQSRFNVETTLERTLALYRELVP